MSLHESFELDGVCTWPRRSVHLELARLLGGEFCEKMKFVVLRCEGWKGQQMSPNEYHENLSARKFLVRMVLHMAKVGSAPRHRLMAGWGVL